MNIPSHNELQKIMRLLRSIVFPDYYPSRDFADQILRAKDAEEEQARQNPAPARKKAAAKTKKQPAGIEPTDQMSIWDVMENS